MLTKLKQLSLLESIITLRFISIFFQISLLVSTHILADIAVNTQAFLWVITLEITLNLISIWYYKIKPASIQIHLPLQLIFDILFLSTLFYFSGGATNAFISLLLIPIAIAAVTLPPLSLVGVSVVAIASYSTLLWLTPMHIMHGNMEGHFIGMWVNFLLSAVVLAVVVGNMARTINVRERLISKYREEQLKKEMIISLGVASAQVTHDIATPINSTRLLVDELLELYPNDELIHLLDKQIVKCSDNLAKFRTLSHDIKANKKTIVKCESLWDQLKSHCLINYPNAQIDFKVTNKLAKSCFVQTDSTLIPAIINVIHNAISASYNSINVEKAQVNMQCTNTALTINVRDYGLGFTAHQQEKLGQTTTHSSQGLGMALLLSNANLERLNGTISLENYMSSPPNEGNKQVEEYGALAIITLPLTKES